MQKKQTRYLLAMVSIFVITCTFLILNGMIAQRRAEKEAMHNRADEFGVLVQDWLEGTEETLQIIDYLMHKSPNPEKYWKELSEIMHELDQRAVSLSDAYVYNENWEIGIVSENGLLDPAEMPEGVHTAFQGALDARGEIFITDPYMAKNYNVYCVTLSKAIYDDNGELIGIACIDCYLDKLISILGESYEEDRYAFLADGEKNIINHPYPAYQMRMDHVQKASDLPYNEAFEHNDIRLIKDYDGKYRACVVSKEEKTGFYVVVLEDGLQVYRRMFDAFLLYTFAMLIGSLLTVGILKSLANAHNIVTQRLMDAAEEARNASKAKSVFLANMSHEIRTPIHAVLGMGEMIMRESTEPQIKEYAMNIQKSGSMLLSIINSILDYSRLESGKMQLYTEEYNILEAVSELENMIAYRAREKGLGFTVDLDENLPVKLIGDQIRIRQINLNLLSNALKYTKSGMIRLEIKLLEQTEESIWVKVSVTDTGIGIKEEDMEKLFLSFERIEEDKNKNIEGSGLGISIVQKLLELMGTALEVESEYGKGSTFFYTLRQGLTGSETIGEFKQRQKEEAGENKYIRILGSKLEGKILVVDDVPINVMILENLLKDTELEVDSAFSGETAIEKLKENRYDLIFLDHMMAEMDGIETLKRIKEEHLADGTYCIVLTANAFPEARKTYLDAGFDDYLVKPMSGEDLYEIIRKYLIKQGKNEVVRTE